MNAGKMRPSSITVYPGSFGPTTLL